MRRLSGHQRLLGSDGGSVQWVQLSFDMYTAGARDRNTDLLICGRLPQLWSCTHTPIQLQKFISCSLNYLADNHENVL